MNGTIGQLISRWRLERAAGRDETLWTFLSRENPWVFAHHPADNCFGEHVWTISGLHFCKGCLMTVSGWVAALIIQCVTDWLNKVPIAWITGVFIVLLTPSVVTALTGAPRVWKHVARFLLGVLMASSIWLFVVTDAWWVRVVLVGVYFAVKIPLDRRRRAENQKIFKLNSVKSPTGKHRRR